MSEEETPLYCELCGDPVDGSATFCAGCGAPIPEGKESEHEGHSSGGGKEE